MAERNHSEPFIEDADRFPEDGTRTRRPPSPDQETRRRKTQQRRRRNSVFQYIAVLFMAAFVLLLFTFMMERRQSQQQIDDLKQSASTVQTLQGLIDENSSLKLRLAELEEQLEQPGHGLFLADQRRLRPRQDPAVPRADHPTRKPGDNSRRRPADGVSPKGELHRH